MVELPRVVPILQRFVPPTLRQDVVLATRAENLIVAMVLSFAGVLGFGLFYLGQGQITAAGICAAEAIAVPIAFALLRGTQRLGVASEFLTGSVFALLLALTYELGGMHAPTVVWLSVCPLIATAAGGRRQGIRWSVIIIGGIALVYWCDVQGLIPATTLRNMRLLEALSVAGFIIIVALFLITYERISSGALMKLDAALALINELAIRDELTGALNRREIVRLAGEEQRKAAGKKTRFCLCLIDVDHFKKINDTYGHAAGDRVLKQVADRIQEEVRASDVFGRYGGEEFVLLLPSTDSSAGLALAERVRQSIEALPLPELPSGAGISVSIGVAEAAAMEMLEETLGRADRALYRAKRNGRNRVQLSTRGQDKAAPQAIESP